MVTSWIEGQQAIGEQITNEAYNSVGGEEVYNNITKWAGELMCINSASMLLVLS